MSFLNLSFPSSIGGDKYIANNILFKFAVDSHGLFNGSDYAAAKVIFVLPFSPYYFP